ncbi:MAG TPA: hypothetical protein VKT28_20275 [Puia sp.]|nr:hypothetical protein [Puia sp.]
MANFLYNPDRKGKEQLIAEFVVRTKVFDDIMHDIKTSKMKTPEQHYLLVGQRGAGKTTLLHRIRYAIEDDTKLNKWLIPVIFSEEQYNVSELANLWENVAHVLEDYHGFKGISEEMEKHITKKNFEEACYEILEKFLVKHKKKIVLLVDNIGDLLKKLEDKEVRRLREILQTKNDLRLIAGSSFYLESILDYKQPLFEFFKVVRLDGLNKEETEELLLKLGEVHNEKEKIQKIIKETPGRIETLRILTGGVPRTIALMFTIFVDYEHEGSVRDLERVLDAVTPLYKHRMDDLPKQQQKIVDAVARNWEAISVKELTEKVRLESKVISAQLRQLEKNQVIEKRETNTKNHLYLLKERFFNIWYLMRYGRKEKAESVKWLVVFMENWYDETEMDKRIDSYVAKIFTEEPNKEMVILFNSVYSSLKKISEHSKEKLTLSQKKWEAKENDKNCLNKIRICLESEDYSKAFNLAINLSYIPKTDLEKIYFAIMEMLKSKGGTLKFLEILKKIIKKYATNENAVSLSFIILSSISLSLRQLIMYNDYKNALRMLESGFVFFESLVEKYGYKFVERYFDLENRILINTIILFLGRRQENSIIDIFEKQGNEVFKDIYKPIYFAALVLKDKTKFASIGDELQESVKSVISRIDEIKNKKGKNELQLT